MSRKIKRSKLFQYYLLKFLPVWIIKLIVRFKGTGVLDMPRYFKPGNSDSLECVIAYNQYGAFCTPLSCKNDTPVQAIYRGEQYEEETIQYIINQKFDGDIVHAGAYFGDSLPGLSKALLDGAVLWAFEPNPESYRCAEITILLNKLANVKLFNFGLGKNSGNTYIKYSDEDAGKMLGGKSRLVSEADQGTEMVKVVRLDDLVPHGRKISLIHLDVEGHEMQVLHGAREIIEKYSPMIILETSNESIESDLKEMKYCLFEGLEKRGMHEGFRNSVFVRD